MTTVVVVGVGLAGVRTVERLRARGFDGRLVLLGAEFRLPYDRPPLSKEVLRGTRQESLLCSLADYDRLNADLRCGQRATGVDVSRRVVQLEDNEVRFDVLVIATGARPRRVPGLGGHVLRTWEDAVALRERLQPGTDLVIVGAGLVGCEVAASARSLDVAVTLVERETGPLVRAVGPVVAQLLADLHRRNGVSLHFGSSATRMSRSEIRISDGTTVRADLVLEAVGAAPESGWLEGSGLSVPDGVECDSHGQTSVGGIFAVGDVANWTGVRHEHWTSAVEQADRAAAAILGQPGPPPEVPYWWSDQYGLKIQALGTPSACDEVVVMNWGPRKRTVALYARKGRVTGIVGFSAPRAVLSTRAEIAAGRDVRHVVDRLAA